NLYDISLLDALPICLVYVHVLAAAIVALAGIALGVLVGQHRTLRLEHGARDDVFGSDKFDLALLASEFEADSLGDLRIGFGDAIAEEAREERNRRGGAHGRLP